MLQNFPDHEPIVSQETISIVAVAIDGLAGNGAFARFQEMLSDSDTTGAVIASIEELLAREQEAKK